MSNSPVNKISDRNADTYFLVAAVAIVTNAVMQSFAGVFDKNVTSGKLMYIFCTVLLGVASIVSYYATIKGFGFVNRKCMLDENNANYYLGRKLQRLAVFSVIFSVILAIVTALLFLLASHYSIVQTDAATAQQAYGNILSIAAIVGIVTLIFDITLPLMIYLWNIHKLSSSDNFALLVVIIMVVQIIIGSLNALYAARGSDYSFLSTFSTFLDVIEGLALMIFFYKRKQTVKE